MTKKYVFFLLLAFIFSAQSSFAQDSSATLRTYRVGIFAPLYLDSVFSDDRYKYDKNFPRFVVPGLDFVQGAQIALDSMPLPNGNIQAQIFDSKSFTQDVPTLIAQHKLDSLELIIGAVKDEEYVQLAEFALAKKIPFISATYPNDGGITNNPYLAIVNSTLKAHCEAIFSYILQNHGTDKILLVRKPGAQEDKVAGYFAAMNKPDGKALLNIQTINIDSNFNVIKSRLDSNTTNVIIGASLDEEFAYSLASAASSAKKLYNITLLGMPNWNSFQSFNGSRKNLSDFPIFFTSPYFNYKWDNYSKMIDGFYLKKYKGKPSENAYKGFETAFIFTRLYTRYPDNFMDHLNDYAYKVFSEYNFKPVSVPDRGGPTDYYENKHLYFLKIMNGNTTKAW